MKKIIYSLAVASLLFVSCKKEAEAEAVTTEATTDSTAVATETTTAPAVATTTPVAGAGANTILGQGNPTTTMTQTVTPQMLNQQNAAPVKVAAGMNPSHGQPGHRCDIAVGAPLNSAPGKAAVTPQPTQAASVPSQSIMTTPPPAAANVVTAPGMNPPHGQAGHDCAVAVGAPLPTK